MRHRPQKGIQMNVMTPTYSTTTAWWEIFASGMAGRPPKRGDSHVKLEAIIAGRRAAASAKMKAVRCRSERGIARLIRECGL